MDPGIRSLVPVAARGRRLGRCRRGAASSSRRSRAGSRSRRSCRAGRPRDASTRHAARPLSREHSFARSSSRASAASARAQTLELRPGSGLTLVVGRNGSGKSSFAEALEVLLTGDSLRWKERAAVWREGWRNLHHPAASLARDVPRRGRARAVRGRRGAGSPRPPSRRRRPRRRSRRQAGVRPRLAGLDDRAAHAPSLPLLQRAGLAARRGAVEALRRALVDPGPRGPGGGAGRAPGGAPLPREGAEGRDRGARPPRRRSCARSTTSGRGGWWRPSTARSGTSARSRRSLGRPRRRERARPRADVLRAIASLEPPDPARVAAAAAEMRAAAAAAPRGARGRAAADRATRRRSSRARCSSTRPTATATARCAARKDALDGAWSKKQREAAARLREAAREADAVHERAEAARRLWEGLVPLKRRRLRARGRGGARPRPAGRGARDAGSGRDRSPSSARSPTTSSRRAVRCARRSCACATRRAPSSGARRTPGVPWPSRSPPGSGRARRRARGRATSSGSRPRRPGSRRRRPGSATTASRRSRRRPPASGSTCASRATSSWGGSSSRARARGAAWRSTSPSTASRARRSA